MIDITIADGKVDPNGRKVDVPLGATVVLNVTSDIDDEIHAHLGNDDFTPERAGRSSRRPDVSWPTRPAASRSSRTNSERSL